MQKDMQPPAFACRVEQPSTAACNKKGNVKMPATIELTADIESQVFFEHPRIVGTRTPYSEYIVE